MVISMLWVGLYPQLISCGTPHTAERTVRVDDAAPSELALTLELEIPYGESADTLGFVPAGDEHEARGPNMFQVADGDKLLVSDPVRGKLFAVEITAGGEAVLETIATLGPRPRPELMEPDCAPAARARKISAEQGEVIFELADGPRAVEIDAAGPLASLRVLGVDRAGRAVVLLERFLELGKLAVDRELLAIDPAAGLVARRAIADAPVVPPLREFVFKGSALYRMVAGDTSVVFTRFEVRP